MASLRPVLVLSLALLLAQSPDALRRRLASVPHRNLAISTPNYTLYHHHEDLLREVESIVKANPGFMKMEVSSEADGDYKAELKVVTVEPGGFSERQEDKVRMLLDFGEHGRELISSELGLLLLRTLAAPGAEALQGVFPGQVERGRELQRLLRGTVIKILPLENEGGRRLVEAGRLCERKNGRGVDPNRNWLVDWGKKEPDYDPTEEYPGTRPFSEPEVKVVRELAADFAPHVWLNIHSGMEAMLAPWDHKAEVAIEAQPAYAMLQRIHLDIMANTTCVVGSGGKSVGYLAHGTATDYMFQVLQVPIASTWEIYGDFQAHFDDCFRMFNPLDEAGMQEVLQRWLRAIMRLIELLPTHPALQHSRAWSLGDTAAPAASGSGTGTDGAGKPAGGGSIGGSTSSSNSSSSDADQKPAVGSQAPAAAAGKETPAEEQHKEEVAAVKPEGSKDAAGREEGNGRGEQGASGADQVGAATAGAAASGANQQQQQQQEQQQQSQQQQQQQQEHLRQEHTQEQSAQGQPTQEQTEQQHHTHTQQSHPPHAGAEDAPRLTVVASQRGWGSSWGSGVFSGLLAVAGLATVGVLAFRCLARTSSDRRRARGGEGYQAV